MKRIRIMALRSNCRMSFLVIFNLFIIVGCARTDSPVLSPTSTPTLTPAPTQTGAVMIEVVVIKDISYVPEGFDEQRLDIYLPSGGAKPYPTLLMIHGGNGRKEDMALWGRAFAKQGYAAVSINHRQWPNYSYPDHVEDAFCALAWVHSNAGTYHFDTKNVFAMGHSAGGTLSAMLGVVDNPSLYIKECPHTLPEDKWVQGIIPFTGIFDYATAIEGSSSLENYAAELLGGELDEIPEIWAAASAVNWLDGSEPPFLIIHGAEDKSISPDQSRYFAEILEEEGVDVDLLIIPDAGHAQIVGSEQSLGAVEEFLSRILRQY